MHYFFLMLSKNVMLLLHITNFSVVNSVLENHISLLPLLRRIIISIEENNQAYDNIPHQNSYHFSYHEI